MTCTMEMFKNGFRKSYKMLEIHTNINFKNIKNFWKSIKNSRKLTKIKILNITKVLQVQRLKNQENNRTKSNLTANCLRPHLILIKLQQRVKSGIISMKWLHMSH